jgi:hypothetical protein
LNVNLTALSVSIFDGDGGGLVLDDLYPATEIADNKWDSIEHRKDRFDGIGRIIQQKMKQIMMMLH